MDVSTANTGNARISSAQVFEVEAPFVTPYGLSKAYGTLATTRAVLIKLTDVDGCIGWGEANPMQPFTAESPREAAVVLRDVLLPLVMREARPDPARVDLLLDAQRDDHLCARGAVSMALLDLLGKRLGTPVATLLGGAVRSSLPVLWPIGTGSAEDDARVIEHRAVQGFTTFMLKMGAASVAEEIRRVADLARRYGDRFKFIADANQGWTRAEAAEFLSGVAGAPIAFVEQPVGKSDIDGMAALAKASPFPISADESLTGLQEAARLASLGAAQVFSIKSSKNGGPLRAQQIATLARAFGIGCYMNSMLEFGITQAASLQHALTVPNLVDAGHAFMSTLRLDGDPTDFSDLVNGGLVREPDRPGLGVTVDEARVQRLSVASDQVAAA